MDFSVWFQNPLFYETLLLVKYTCDIYKQRILKSINIFWDTVLRLEGPSPLADFQSKDWSWPLLYWLHHVKKGSMLMFFGYYSLPHSNMCDIIGIGQHMTVYAPSHFPFFTSATFLAMLLNTEDWLVGPMQGFRHQAGYFFNWMGATLYLLF